MNKNYQRGVRLERFIISELSEQGYSTLRTAGSHGFADVIAINKQLVRLIQGKASKSPTISLATYKADLAKILNTPTPPNVTRELWIKRDRQPIYRILIL